MIIFDIDTKQFVIFSEAQKETKLAEIKCDTYFKQYNITLYAGWDSQQNVIYTMKAINAICDIEIGDEIEQLTSADLLKASINKDFCHELYFGADLDYGLQEVKIV